MSRAKVTIVVVVFKTERGLLAASLSSARKQADTEVVVIDNSPSRVLGDEFEGLVDKWIWGHGNVGFARAANMGVDRSEGDYVLLLNPDAWLSAGALSSLCRAARVDPDSLFCGWLHQNGEPQVDAYLHWWFSTERLLRRRAYKAYLTKHESASAPVRVLKVSGGALFAKKSLLTGLGPFDERFFLYGEDADLSVRARRSSVPLYAVPTARIEHRAASSQNAHSVLVESARADAAVRVSRYHMPYALSLLTQLDLFVVTAVGLVRTRAGSSATARGRWSRFQVLVRWGFRRDREPFSPQADNAARVS